MSRLYKSNWRLSVHLRFYAGLAWAEARVAALRLYARQWSESSEITSVEYLNACVVLTVKRGLSIWATCLERGSRTIEPQPQVIKLDRSGFRICRDAGKHSPEY